MKRLSFLLPVLNAFFLLIALSCADRVFAQTKSPEGAKVYIIAPKEGEVVSKEVRVIFGLKGMGVAPAGVDAPNTGHHHLLVDVDKLPDMGKPIPKDANHMHFGGGQAETVITLTPGTHTLQLLLGDMNHIPHSPPVISEKINITVK